MDNRYNYVLLGYVGDYNIYLNLDKNRIEIPMRDVTGCDKNKIDTAVYHCKKQLEYFHEMKKKDFRYSSEEIDYMNKNK